MPREQRDFSSARVSSRYPAMCRGVWAGTNDGSGNRWLHIVRANERGTAIAAQAARELLQRGRCGTPTMDAELRALAREYILPLRWSGHAGCRAAPPTDCLVQVPKTGSTSMKLALGLLDPCSMQPVAPRSRAAALSANATAAAIAKADRDGWMPCRRLLIPIRNPIERFLSAVGTVYARTQATLRAAGRSNCSAAAATTEEEGGPCVWPPLDSEHAFIMYGLRLLGLVERSLSTCQPTAVGLTAFGSDAGSDAARHLLPQALFAASAPPEAVLYPTTVADFQAGARSLRLGAHACGGAPAACLMNNTREGSRQGVHRPDVAALPMRLRARIESVYAMDFELVRRLHG